MEAVLEFVKQPWWGDLIALYLFLGGLGSTLFILSYYYWCKMGEKQEILVNSLLSVVIVFVGVLMLILDLGHPERAYYVYLYAHFNSWIVIGTLLLTFFLVFGAVFVAPMLIPKVFGWLKPYMKATGLLASLLGLGVAIYTGILIGVVESVPIWHTPLLPVLFLVSAFSTGLSLYGLVISPKLLGLKEQDEKKRLSAVCHTLAFTDGVVMIFELFLISLWIMFAFYGPPAAKASAEMLVYGELSPLFLGVLLILGLLVPILLIFGYELRGKGTITKIYVSMLCSTLVLLGGLILRYVVLEAGLIQVSII